VRDGLGRVVHHNGRLVATFAIVVMVGDILQVQGGVGMVVLSGAKSGLRLCSDARALEDKAK
jgi:hypothetical protein